MGSLGLVTAVTIRCPRPSEGPPPYQAKEEGWQGDGWWRGQLGRQANVSATETTTLTALETN